MVTETESDPPPFNSVVDVPNAREEGVQTEAKAAEVEANVSSKVQKYVEAGNKRRAPRKEGNSLAGRPVFTREIK